MNASSRASPLVDKFRYKRRRGDEDTCEVHHCRKPVFIRVLGRDLCREHWEKHCDREAASCP